MPRVITKSASETKRLAASLAREVVRIRSRRARVVALEGELGSGKTVFVQGFAEALGVREKVQSPTFVLVRVYKPDRQSSVAGRKLKHVIHIDCYRLASTKELSHLGFENWLRDRDAVILTEWAGRVRSLIPKNALWVRFKHGKKSHERILKISN